MTLGRRNESLALAEQVHDARVKSLGADHSLAISALNNLAKRYEAIGKMPKAMALYEEARNSVIPKLGADHPSTLIILDNLSRMYRTYRRNSEAIPLAKQVRDARLRTLGAYHPDTITTLDNLGQAYQSAGQNDEALAAFEQAGAGLENSDFVHGEAGLIVGNLCDCLELKGQVEQADLCAPKVAGGREETRRARLAQLCR